MNEVGYRVWFGNDNLSGIVVGASKDSLVVVVDTCKNVLSEQATLVSRARLKKRQPATLEELLTHNHPQVRAIANTLIP